jgi:PPOX class probable F420-dependent enzyme
MSTDPGRVRFRGFVLGVLALTGLGMAAAGVWCVAAPGSFATAVGFSGDSVHFIHDAGAFQIGLGAMLLLAVWWRDAPAVALAAFFAGNTVHTVNHAVDADIGGHASETVALGAVSVLVGAALLLRLRQIGYVVGEVAASTTPALAPFVRQKTVLLTTYRRDGTPVATPLSLAVDGDHGYVRTWHTAGKAKRLRNDPRVTVAPSTARGRLTGPALDGEARRLDGAEARHAARTLARRQPLLHALLVPLAHRLMRVQTVHYALTPVRVGTGAGARTDQAAAVRSGPPR